LANIYTAFLNLIQPEVGANRNVWGQHWNSNATLIDTGVKAASDAAAAASTDAGTRVLRAGDTMTGALTAPSFKLDANGMLTLASGVVSLAFDSGDFIAYDRPTNTMALTIGAAVPLIATAAAIALTVPLTLSGNPTATYHAAPKTYVDTAVAASTAVANTKLPLGGGTLSGTIYGPAAYMNYFRFKDDPNSGIDVGGSRLNLVASGAARAFVDGSGFWVENYGYLQNAFARLAATNTFTQSQSIQCYDASIRLSAPAQTWDMAAQADGVLRWYVSANAGAWRMGLDSSGNIYATGDVTAYSDARVKTDIETITDALSIVLKLKGRRYRRTDHEDTAKVHVGLVAQEVAEVLPEVVKQADPDHLSVSYGNVVAVLIEAIKELSEKVEALESRV
jgi:hypothetical protein